MFVRVKNVSSLPFYSSLALPFRQLLLPTKRSRNRRTRNVTQRARFTTPNGIGKFYLGREIAYVMGHQAAGWLERPEREREEKLSLLIKSLKLKPGMNVADIGAGSGVISLLMAKEVGEKGTVYAVDIQQEMLDLLSAKTKKLGVKNIKPVKGVEDSPKLKPNTIDLAIMVDVYHEFEYPYEMMADIVKSLKVGGRVVLVEYRMEDPLVPIKLVHKMSEAQVKKELGQDEFNLKWLETYDKLPRQHVIFFEKLPKEKE